MTVVPTIRMIATDIDGTMLTPAGTLSPNVRAALHEAVDSGIHVVPATGRPLVITTGIMDALNLDDYWIFANGAITWHAGRSETVRGYWMEPEKVRSMIASIRQFVPNAGFAVEFESEAIFERGFERLVPVGPGLHLVDDVAAAVNARVQKVLVFDHATTLDDLFQKTELAVGHEAVPSYSGMSFIEVAADLVTKAMAVMELAEDLGIERAEVASFGDNHNDVSMLEWAGRGYAMGNATADAKQAADYVIGSNADDALASQVRALIAEQG